MRISALRRWRRRMEAGLDAGCWMLDAGCWMLDAGCWMLDAGGEGYGIVDEAQGWNCWKNFGKLRGGQGGQDCQVGHILSWPTRKFLQQTSAMLQSHGPPTMPSFVARYSQARAWRGRDIAR